MTQLPGFWMPFTANRLFQARPRRLVAAEGMYYRSADGRRILDGTAGLWCVNAGHARPEITAAVQRQLATLDFAPTFQMGHPLAERLAARLADVAPPGLTHAFFANSGSEAADSALKIALAYHQRRGEPERTVLIGRERAYHGVGFGGMSVGGIAKNREAWRHSLLPDIDHLRHTHDPARNAFARGQPEHGAEFADDLERLVTKHGARRIAAVIIEPVAGSTGVLVPPRGYLERLRALCDRHGLLLILDEVITGFGRTGSMFAAQQFGVRADLMTCAKGLTNGAIPMGAVLVSAAIFEAFMQGPLPEIDLFHGYTYSGHPVACAAALAALDIYQGEQLAQRATHLAPQLAEAAHALRGLPGVVDVRNCGLIAAVEFASEPGRAPTRAFEIFHRCFEQGLLVRATGDVIALSPPLVVTEAQIGAMFATLAGAIRATP
ncbi:MAG: aspartate aminotransferase family protein [Gammaproteobacteria bacterium]|nr:aspartate aminotransferase family protein [Gammaproteobacteria bacterium]